MNSKRKMVIYRYKLNKTEREITLPEGSRILSIKGTGNDVAVYVLQDIEYSKTEKVHFKRIGTGCKIEEDMTKWIFLGTVSLFDGAYFTHVFYRK